ncbi:MAG: cyclase family protein [Caldithrix sp.]|nr:cyclase family protein [Caldithrix sp.]
MQVIDCSHNLDASTLVFPGTPAIRTKGLKSIQQDGFREKQITFTTHCGTHMDAPAHVLQDGSYLDQLPPETFFGKGQVIDISAYAAQAVEAEYLERQTLDEDTEFILFHTGQSLYWGQDAYFNNYPWPGVSLADLIVQHSLKGVGIDAISIEPIESSDVPVHKTLLGAGLVIIENLTNLQRLIGKSFWLTCFPLKITGADGSPIRAAAVLE